MIELVLGLSLAFIMFSLGLSLSPDDFAVAFRQPKALFSGLLCQVILLPLVAFCLITFFQLQGELAFGVMILSCCPGGITSNVMTRWARGDVALSISYTAIVSLLTALTLPLILSIASTQFLSGRALDLNVLSLSLKVFAIATLPVLIGVLIRKVRPASAAALERSCALLSNALFALILLATLISQWAVFTGNLMILGPILLSLNLMMLFIGCCLGSGLKLPREQVTTLAIESGFQNGTIGIVVGTLVSQPVAGVLLSQSSLPSAVYGVLMLVTIAPFLLWRRSITKSFVGYSGKPGVMESTADITTVSGRF